MRLIEPNSIRPNAADPASLFAHFWALRSGGEYAAALLFCDIILELIPPGDACSQLRQTNARAMAHRDLLDFRAAYRTHAGARFLLAHAPLTYVGDHYHGLGVTLTELGEHVRAFKCLESARFFHAGEPAKLAHTGVSTARLLTHMGKGSEALAVLDALEAPALAADVQVARALAHSAEGDRRGARLAIAAALALLADSENEATRKEALSVLAKIEGPTK